LFNLSKGTKIREVDNDKYMSMLRSLTEEGRDVSLLISGSSMAPFLVHHRDYILFGKPNRELKKGDMVFFQRLNGYYVMHRILRVRPEGYYIVGDAQTDIEGPIRREQIFGLIKKVQRKGKWIDGHDFWWKFFEKIWINIVPLRPYVLKVLGIGYRLIGRK
jgi:hypothetical protein